MLVWIEPFTKSNIQYFKVKSSLYNIFKSILLLVKKKVFHSKGTFRRRKSKKKINHHNMLYEISG